MNESESRWVLKSADRNYFLCAAGEEAVDALCVFRSREAAERHLAGLSEASVFMDTLERQSTGMPDWMKEDSLLPEPRKVFGDDLRKILEATEMRYVAVDSDDGPYMELLEIEGFLKKMP